MKKHLFLLFALVFAFAGTTRAQLVVDSLGRVGIGTETPKTDMQVGDDGLPDAKMSISAAKQYGLSVFNRPPVSADASAAIKVYEISRSKNGTGVDVSATGIVNDSTSSVVGLRVRAGGYGNVVGVMGVLNSSNIKNYAGVYGGVSRSSTPSFQYPGRYAGYFDGPVLVTRNIYGNVFSLTSTPKSSANANVQTMNYESDGAESISDRLMSVQTVQFVREEEVDPVISEGQETGLSDNAKSLDVSAYSAESADEAVESNVKTEMVKHYGLDGEQLKAVFPELVVEDSQGNYRVNYSEMVPLLLQSIRELKSEIDELKGNKGVVVQKSRVKAMSMEEEGASTTDVVCMSQNKPNPFSESSVITLNVPEDTKSASIYVYDLSGKQVKSIPVNQRGETDITVYASDLQEGMFVYSLVVDGTVVATRRMMVVKN